MRLYYKGNVAEVHGDETEGRGLARNELRMDAGGRHRLHEVSFQKRIEDGEIVLRWQPTTRKDYDRIEAEAHRRTLQWLWNH